MTLLQDVSLVDEAAVGEVTDLRAALGITGPIMLYVGNLEPYQGIDLLLEVLGLWPSRRSHGLRSSWIGGIPRRIEAYRQKATELGLSGHAHAVGPRPVTDLGAYLAQADVLASPRLSGANTPMKIYSYIDSGGSVLATRPVVQSAGLAVAQDPPAPLGHPGVDPRSELAGTRQPEHRSQPPQRRQLTQ